MMIIGIVIKSCITEIPKSHLEVIIISRRKGLTYWYDKVHSKSFTIPLLVIDLKEFCSHVCVLPNLLGHTLKFH
jgi:hypothetical protein